MTFKELAVKSEAELRTLLAEKRDELRTLRFKVAADQHKNVRAIRASRTTIAQILTILNKQPSLTKPTDHGKR